MSKLEVVNSHPIEASNSVGVTDVLGEVASSAWKAGVVRPFVGVAQLAGADVHMTPDRELTGVMRGAQVVGHGAGVLFDLYALSRFVGRGVTAAGEATQMKSLMMENSLAKSLTTSGATGFTDGFALNPTQPGEGMGNRFAHGVAEAAGFMALDGSARYLRSMPEGAMKGVGNYGFLGEAADKMAAHTPIWIKDAGRAIERDAQKMSDIVSSRFPSLTIDNMALNGAAGYVGGAVYYNTDTVLNGKTLSAADSISTGFGWAVGNAFLGGKAAAKPVEVKPDVAPKPDVVDPATIKPEMPPAPSYKPEAKTLENGSQQWTYRDIPNKGDETVYTRSAQEHELHNPKLDWQIKTADGKVYDRNTQGPWEINYPDGSSLVRNEFNYLSFNKPVTVNIGGKDQAVKEVTQMHSDQTPIAKQWVYEDPAVPGQTVTFNADRTWEAVGADGKSFSYRSPGPWKVTNLDGFVETIPAGGKDIDVEHIAGHSNWRDFVGSAEPQSVAGGPRRPRVFPLSASDTSPMSLSQVARNLEMVDKAGFE